MRNIPYLILLSGLFAVVSCLSPLVFDARASGPNFNDTTSKPASSASPSFSGTVTLPGGVWGTDGNVGIGTTAPVLKLDVDGVIASGNVSGNGELRSYQVAASNYVSLKTLSPKSGLFRNNTDFFVYYDTVNGNTALDATYVGSSVLFNILGAEKMRVANSGNVGIGTTAPEQKLEVTGNAKVSGTVFGNMFNDSLAGSNALSFATANNPVLYGYTSTNLDTVLGTGYLAFKIATAEKVRIDQNGNVGIGTNSPTAALTFPAASTGIVLHNQVDQVTNTETGFVRWSASKFQIGTDKAGTGTARTLEFFTGGVSRFTLTGAGDFSPTSDNTLYLGLSDKRFHTAYFSNTINLGGSTPEVRLLASGSSYFNGGNVGIATTSPSAKLQVGTGVKSLSADLSANSALIIGNLEVDGKIYGDGSSLTGVPTVSAMSAGYIPRASSATALTNSVMYDNGANVGISTTSPTAKLDLVGTGTTSATSALVIRDANKAAKITILDDGNIGIGTTVPGYKLEVTGNAKVSNSATVNGYVYFGATGGAVSVYGYWGSVASPSHVTLRNIQTGGFTF